MRRAVAAATGMALLLLGVAVPSSPAGPARRVVVWGAGVGVAAGAVEAAGADVDDALGVVGGVVAALDDRQVGRLETAGLLVADDAPMEVADAGFDAVPVADLQLAAVNPGNDWDLDSGAGIGVALVDTGVTEVADLRGRVVHGPDLSGEGTTVDTYGHGTFMAGLIAGDGELSAAGASRHVGVAPGAHIVSVKVAGADGSTSLARVLEAIGWVVEHGDAFAVRVMNLSVAVPPLSADHHADPLSFAVEAAWSSGVTVVAASGNDGSYVTSPGRDPYVLTVGALDTGALLDPADDAVPAWSGREALRYGAKPELLAPGVSVISLAAPGSRVVAENPGSVVGGDYLVGSGTSMAAALASGAVAALTEHHAAATPDDFKAALVSTGRPVAGEIGRALDLAAADLAAPGEPARWWQRHPLAGDGLGAGVGSGVGMPWTEGRWADDAWVGARWAGTRWAGARWAEHTWTGGRWAPAGTAGARWAGARWAGARWAGARWTGARWAGARWAGTGWAAYAAD